METIEEGIGFDLVNFLIGVEARDENEFTVGLFFHRKNFRSEARSEGKLHYVLPFEVCGIFWHDVVVLGQHPVVKDHEPRCVGSPRDDVEFLVELQEFHLRVAPEVVARNNHGVDAHDEAAELGVVAGVGHELAVSAADGLEDVPELRNNLGQLALCLEGLWIDGVGFTVVGRDDQEGIHGRYLLCVVVFVFLFAVLLLLLVRRPQIGGQVGRVAILGRESVLEVSQQVVHGCDGRHDPPVDDLVFRSLHFRQGRLHDPGCDLEAPVSPKDKGLAVAVCLEGMDEPVPDLAGGQPIDEVGSPDGRCEFLQEGRIAQDGDLAAAAIVEEVDLVAVSVFGGFQGDRRPGFFGLGCPSKDLVSVDCVCLGNFCCCRGRRGGRCCRATGGAACPASVVLLCDPSSV
mmetsp:Transcript_21483/g.44171  ORF Transcript_21483/g.44171 Transcript_21483/m.44171 type:complete len:402 (-) Transcript_21483:475-1680(-)